MMNTRIVGAMIATVLGIASAYAQQSSTTAEGTGTGSGSTGMAPQQGTGSGATQHSPGANRPEANQTPGADSRMNREYGKEVSPTGPSLSEGQAAPPKR